MQKKILKINALALLITTGIIGLVLWQINTDSLIAAAKNISPLLSAGALFMMSAQVLILALRWQTLVNLDRPIIHARSLIKFSLLGAMTNFILVIPISGVLLRMAMTINAGATPIKAICASIMDRMLSIGSLLAFTAISLPFFLQKTGALNITSHLSPTLIVVSFAVVVLLVMVIRPNHLEKITKSSHFIRTKFYLFRLVRARNLGVVATYSICAQASFFIGTYLILRACGAEITILQMMVVLPIISTISSLPISVSGWGVREGLFVVGLGLYGIEAEVALLASIQVGIYTMLAAIILGLPTLFDHSITDNIKGALSKSKELLDRLTS